MPGSDKKAVKGFAPTLKVTKGESKPPKKNAKVEGDSNPVEAERKQIPGYEARRNPNPGTPEEQNREGPSAFYGRLPDKNLAGRLEACKDDKERAQVLARQLHYLGYPHSTKVLKDIPNSGL